MSDVQPTGDVNSLLQSAKQAFRKGEHTQALSEVQNVIALEPNHLEAHLLLGICLSMLQRAPEAVQAFTRAVELNPSSPHAHYNLGVALQLTRHPAQAAQNFETALRLDPTHLKAAKALEGIRRSQQPQPTASISRQQQGPAAAGQPSAMRLERAPPGVGPTSPQQSTPPQAVKVILAPGGGSRRNQRIAGAIATAVIFAVMFGWRTVYDYLAPISVEKRWLIILLVAVCAAVCAAVLLALYAKSEVLKAMPIHFRFLPAQVGDYPDLDVSKLGQYTEALESLGFTREMDFTVAVEAMPPPGFPTGFARRFSHAEHHCHAEVNQAFPPNATPSPMNITISTELEEGWSLSTTDRKPDAIVYMLRRPRSLWTSLPDTSPHDLLEIHLRVRKNIGDDLGVDVVTDVSRELYFAREQEEALARKEAMKRKLVFSCVIDACSFLIKPKHEWLGEYANARAARHRST